MLHITRNDSAQNLIDIGTRGRVGTKLAEQRAALKDDSAETLHGGGHKSPCAAPTTPHVPQLLAPPAPSVRAQMEAQRTKLHGMYQAGHALLCKTAAAGKGVTQQQACLDGIGAKLRFVDEGIHALKALEAGDMLPALAHAAHLAQEAMVKSGGNPEATKAAWQARARYAQALAAKE